MDISSYNQAVKILNEFPLYNLDSNLFHSDNNKAVSLLFESVVDLISESAELKDNLPKKEFVIPVEKYKSNNLDWKMHFQDPDNQKFFLSDVYDYLLLITKEQLFEKIQLPLQQFPDSLRNIIHAVILFLFAFRRCHIKNSIDIIQKISGTVLG